MAIEHKKSIYICAISTIYITCIQHNILTLRKIYGILKKIVGGSYMSITLYDLYHQSKSKYKLKLIAGETGLKNVVSWVQFTEDIMTVNFLKGSELILTTGLNANNTKWIYEFVKELMNQKSTGLIINIGNYIVESDINEEIKEMCNKNEFPLFIMPWEIRLSDIMQDFCSQLLRDSKDQDNITIALKEIIFHPDKASSYMNELNSYGYYQNENYNVLGICFNNRKELDDRSKHDFINISNILIKEEFDYHMYLEGNMLIIIMHHIDRLLVERIVEILEKYKQIVRIGVGDICDNLYSIALCYHQAVSAINVARYKDVKKCYFEDLGMYRILFFVSDLKILEKIYKESLDILEEYDNNRGSNLLETLELYVRYDTSIQKVADKTFTHRNTVNYRVKKIKELLNDDISTMESKSKLQMAFYIKNYLSLKRQTGAL